MNDLAEGQPPQRRAMGAGGEIASASPHHHGRCSEQYPALLSPIRSPPQRVGSPTDLPCPIGLFFHADRGKTSHPTFDGEVHTVTKSVAVCVVRCFARKEASDSPPVHLLFACAVRSSSPHRPAATTACRFPGRCAGSANRSAVLEERIPSLPSAQQLMHPSADHVAEMTYPAADRRPRRRFS